MSVKVRIAPSPTGNLHIGTAQSALFNWLFARHYGGEFILRIEDTDLERSDKKFEQNIIDGLHWLGIQWDNDVIVRQTERLDMYEQYLKQLLDGSKAFYCHHTMEELEQERQAQQANKSPLRHACEHKGTDKGTQEGGIIRLAVDASSKRKIIFNDMIRGPIEWEEGLLGDISIAKNLRTPLYHMAVVCDDIEMEISHVLRGEDHISNTPKQILIYEALGKAIPQFGHLPLLLGTDRSKLSKRNGTTAVGDYQKDYLPEALVNFIGLLNYTYSKEIMTKEEMVKEFEIEKVHKNGAVVDIKKLNWINAHYIRALDTQKFKELVGRPDLSDAAVPMMKERMEKFSDAEEFSFFWSEPLVEVDMLIWKKSDNAGAVKALQTVREIVVKNDAIPGREQLDAVATEQFDADRGAIYWPLRVALSGKKASPDPIEIATVIGKEATLRRIDAALALLS